MRRCFVPFCNSKNKDQPNRTMFSVPRVQTLFAQWTEALPKVRPLRYTDKVCYLHFKSDDVISTFDHCINGQIYKIKRDRPKLKPDAVPCLRMVKKDELLLYRSKACLTSSPKVVEMSDDNELITDNNYELIMEEPQQEHEEQIIYENFQVLEEEVEEINANIILEDNNYELNENDESGSKIGDLAIELSKSAEMEFTTKDTNNDNLLITQRINMFNLIYDNAYEVLTPNKLCGIHLCPNRSFICFSYMEVAEMKIRKIISIKTNGSVQLLIDGNAIKSWQLVQDIDSLDSLSRILNRVNIWRLCAGKVLNSNCDIIVEPNNYNCCMDEDNEQIFFCKLCFQKQKE